MREKLSPLFAGLRLFSAKRLNVLIDPLMSPRAPFLSATGRLFVQRKHPKAAKQRCRVNPHVIVMLDQREVFRTVVSWVAVDMVDVKSVGDPGSEPIA